MPDEFTEPPLRIADVACIRAAETQPV